MKLNYIPALISLLSGGFLALSSAPAQAFSFTTNFDAGSNAPKGDIWLKSVSLQDGTVINDFALVESAKILYNDSYRGGNTGAASSEKGDNASGVKLEGATDSSIVASLGNLNLNNIIDTEDSGKFTVNLFFDSKVNRIFFWERGMNSKLAVQALDAKGNALGNLLTLNSKNWKYAGYDIDNTEINYAQRVGSLGITLAELGVSGSVSGIQLTSQPGFNGPDFKVAAESVPEPATLAGIGLIAGTLLLSRRRKDAEQA
ncbi:MAG: PEP-CTERM sorting domain-containing protein [Cyanobacteria bacterium CRU_2_1]|nr:PEP-CTERM sorting domain-containing protein [Cyanobacteria bacterium RU_5_0]NJR59527.1 PEP-CTERM sorting domain-containing protein [Cyanobacteria bacterium CRU_2_1]